MPEIDFAALTPLILCALWALVLLVLLFFARTAAMAGGKRAVNTFRAVGDTE